MAGTSVGRINLDLGLNTKGFKSQLSGIAKQGNGLSSVFGKLGGVIAGAFAVKSITSFAKECLELGSDLAEVQNVVDVTFGSMSGKVDEFAKSAMTAYGLSEKTAKEYMGQFGAMSKAFGNTTEAAYDQSEALTALTGDVASFYNLSTDEAFTKLKAVYTGETESLKSLGVVMTQTALDEFAMAQGMGKTTKDMTEQEKVALRLAFVTDRLSAASGDFARTSDGWATQTRILSLQFDQLKATIGQGLINALLPVIRLLNTVMQYIQKVAEAFSNLMAKVFGDAGSADSAGGVLTEGSDTFVDNMDTAASSAQAIKKSLSGFDKINLLGSSDSGATSTPSISSGSETSGVDAGAAGGAGGGLTGFDTSDIEKNLVDITALVSTFVLAIGAILAFTGANIPLGIGLIALGAVGLGSAVAMSSALSDEIAGTVDLITVIVSGAFLAVGAILALTGVNMGLGIALMVIGAAGMAAEAAMNWDSLDGDIKSTMATIALTVGAGLLALGAVFAFSGAAIPLGIGLMVAGGASLAAGVALRWNELKKDLSATLQLVGAIVGGALLALGALFAFGGINIPLGIGMLVAGAAALAVAVIAPNWQTISQSLQGPIGAVTAIVGGALLVIGAILLFTGASIPLGLGLLAAGGVALGTSIAANWGWLTTKVKEICEDIGQFFSDVWQGITDGVKGCVNGVIGFFEWLINKLIGGLNWLIDAINSLSFTVPDWVPGIGGKKFGFNIPRVSEVTLPRLAAGGYVAANTPQLAVIGDNMHEGEIVAPESKIAEAVARGFAMVLAKMQQTQGAQRSTQTPVIIKIGETDFWHGFIDFHNSEVARTGESPLLV